MPPVAVVGNLSRDLVDGGPPRIGGAPWYAARALRLLGRRAHIVARCGDAERRLFLRRLTALGLPVHLLHGQTTATFAIGYDGDRRAMSVEALGDVWTPRDVDPQLLGGATWVHVAPLLRSDFPPETIARLAHGRRLSLDGQGLVRAARVGPLALEPAANAETLRHVAVLKLAEEEARVLLGGDADAGALGELGVPEVIVTRGARGSRVWTAGHVVDVPARPVDAADPTGAGDAFAACYVAGRSDGLPPAAAARRATALVAALLAGRGR